MIKVVEAEEVQIVNSDERRVPADEEEAAASTSKQAPCGQKRARGRWAVQSARCTFNICSPSSPDRWRSFDDADSVQRWFTLLGIDSANYRVCVLDYVIDEENVRDQGEKMVFFYDFFKVGFRLSVDPFIALFLIESKAIPADLMLNTVRILVSYVVVCRLLSFEPSLYLLRRLFFFLRIVRRARSPAVPNRAHLRCLATSRAR